MSEQYAISRLDLADAGTYGWQVRFQRQGTKYGKFFADRSYGGRTSALKQAIEWRDQLLKQLSGSQTVRRHQVRSPRNNSGVVGVSKVTVRANGAEYCFWQATWTEGGGVRKAVKFSVRRYGEKEAFRLAVEARRRSS